MQVHNKKILANEANTAHPFLMGFSEDDEVDGIRPLGPVNSSSPSQTPSEYSAESVRMSVWDWLVYLMQPVDTTDSGWPCSGSRGAYDHRAVPGLAKAFLWIGIGIAAALSVSLLQ